MKYFRWQSIFDCRRPLEKQPLQGHPSLQASTVSRVQQSELDELTQVLDKEAEAMEADLSRWHEQVHLFRSEFYYLNYFTMSQILTLCHQLGLFLRSWEVSIITNQAYVLLQAVLPQVSPSDVKDALFKVAQERQRHHVLGQSLSSVSTEADDQVSAEQRDLLTSCDIPGKALLAFVTHLIACLSIFV